LKLQRKSTGPPGDTKSLQLQRKSGNQDNVKNPQPPLQRKSSSEMSKKKPELTPWIDDENTELSGLEKDLARLEGPKKLTRKSANDVPQPAKATHDPRRSTFPEDDFERKPRGMSQIPVPTPAMSRESVERKRGLSQPPVVVEPVRHLDLNWRSGAGKREEATILKYFPVVPIQYPKPPGQP